MISTSLTTTNSTPVVDYASPQTIIKNSMPSNSQSSTVGTSLQTKFIAGFNIDELLKVGAVVVILIFIYIKFLKG